MHRMEWETEEVITATVVQLSSFFCFLPKDYCDTSIILLFSCFGRVKYCKYVILFISKNKMFRYIVHAFSKLVSVFLTSQKLQPFNHRWNRRTTNNLNRASLTLRGPNSQQSFSHVYEMGMQMFVVCIIWLHQIFCL